MNQFTKLIAAQLNLKEQAVENTLALLEEGCTIPFISRYRKEKTGNMDEVNIEAIAQANEKLSEMAKRKETILKTIEEQGKLSDELKKRIEQCWDATELEDIYLPYKPKRRTRAQIAREAGLEPLAQLLLFQRERNPEQAARKFVGDKVKDVEAALQGAKDIIAETVSENEQSRNQIRGEFRRGAIITSKVVAKKKDEEEAQRFSDYFDFSEPLKKCSSHRLLAMRRGEAAGFLRVSISADDEQCQDKLKRHYVHGFGECQTLVGEAVDDAFKRLLKPSIETEFAALSKQKADEEAIVVFAENLRQLLLAAPLGQKRVMAVDPGFANGCKTCCLDAQGNLIHHEIVYPHPPRNRKSEATAAIQRMVKMYQVEAMAVGNGTASRETSDWLHSIDFVHPVDIYVVSEDGASIYSASKIARDEFPDEDVTVRGAVSIGRRLMDPLAELVKIDPKSIGVGQYQHDVDQTQLKKSLDTVVMSCVNSVGVNLNTASQHLLTYVSGLGPTLAKNIVEYRRENGAFASRAQLTGFNDRKDKAGRIRTYSNISYDTQYGDYIIWEEILHEVASRANNVGDKVIFVTSDGNSDKKYDLMYRVKGKTVGPYISMLNEMYDLKKGYSIDESESLGEKLCKTLYIIDGFRFMTLANDLNEEQVRLYEPDKSRVSSIPTIDDFIIDTSYVNLKKRRNDIKLERLITLAKRNKLQKEMLDADSEESEILSREVRDVNIYLRRLDREMRRLNKMAHMMEKESDSSYNTSETDLERLPHLVTEEVTDLNQYIKNLYREYRRLSNHISLTEKQIDNSEDDLEIKELFDVLQTYKQRQQHIKRKIDELLNEDTSENDLF